MVRLSCMTTAYAAHSPTSRRPAPHECFARAIEYEIDENSRTVREVWTSSDDDDPDRVISWAMGDAHRLENDNMLVIDSTCLPTRQQLTSTCHVTDLTWNEWKREEWHPSDMPYWTRIRERNVTTLARWCLRFTFPNRVNCSVGRPLAAPGFPRSIRPEQKPDVCCGLLSDRCKQSSDATGSQRHTANAGSQSAPRATADWGVSGIDGATADRDRLPGNKITLLRAQEDHGADQVVGIGVTPE